MLACRKSLAYRRRVFDIATARAVGRRNVRVLVRAMSDKEARSALRPHSGAKEYSA